MDKFNHSERHSHCDKFNEDGNGTFTIKSDNVFSQNDQLHLYNIYELIAFNSEGAYHRYIKLMAVYLENPSEFKIIAIDIETNEVLTKSKNFSEAYNQWLIVEPLYLADDLQKKVMKYCDSLSISNYCKNKSNKSIEFSFSKN